MFVDSGPLESHKPLQHPRVFAPQEPISPLPSPREMAACGEWMVPASKELRFTLVIGFELSVPGRRCRSHSWRSRLEVWVWHTSLAHSWCLKRQDQRWLGE